MEAAYGYEKGSIAPGETTPGGGYPVLHNMIRAHVAAYRLYESKYKASQRGWIFK